MKTACEGDFGQSRAMRPLRQVLAKLYNSAELENREVILRLLEVDESARLLDLGCGDGSFTLQLAKRIGTSDLCGIDVVEEFVKQCEAKGVRAIRADLNEPLSLASESFDVLHACQVWEHLHHTDLFMSEIFRVVRPGGYVLISVPNLAVWHNMVCLFLGWQLFSTSISDEIHLGNPLNPSYKVKRAEGSHPSHRRTLCYRGLKELLQYHGFKVEKIVGVGYYPFPTKIGRVLSRLDARHALFLTAKARKV